MNELRQHMNENGIYTDHLDLNLDGTLHRFGKNGPHDSKDEWYIGFQENNYIYCTYGSWSSGEKFTFRTGNIDPEELKRYQQQSKERFEQYKHEHIRSQIEARERAQEIFSKCTPQQHAYLTNKKLESKAPVIKESLVVPYYNFENEIQTLQFISPTGEKKFLSKGKVLGCYHPIGDIQKANTIYLCEGYATALTVHTATNSCVLCCGSLNNINPVTSQIKALHSDSDIVLCQDVGESASKHAEEWKNKYGGVVYSPNSEVKGYDFNDLFQEKGLEAVKEALQCNAFPTFSVDDIESMFTQQIEWLVPGQITKNSVTMVHAKGGVGKSRVLYELMFSLAERDVNIETKTEYPKENSGIRWLWWNIPRVHKCLYIDTELMGYQIKERIKETVLRRKSVYDPDDIKFIVKQEFDNYFNLYDKKTRKMLDNSIKDYDVIFIDNMQNAMIDDDTGPEDKENAAKHWYIVYSWMKSWIRHGKSFILAHHTGKSGSYRGTSRQEGDVDAMIKLSYPEEKKVEIQDDVDMAFVYEMEKGREVRHADRKPFLAQLDKNFFKYRYNWRLAYLDQIQKEK